jgi:hypothetical protein
MLHFIVGNLRKCGYSVPQEPVEVRYYPKCHQLGVVIPGGRPQNWSLETEENENARLWVEQWGTRILRNDHIGSYIANEFTLPQPQIVH